MQEKKLFPSKLVLSREIAYDDLEVFSSVLGCVFNMKGIGFPGLHHVMIRKEYVVWWVCSTASQVTLVNYFV